MKNYLSLILFFCLSYVHLFADTYVWEDYDDFSGSSLDTNKWDVGYFEGGQNAVVSGGKAELIGTGFTGSDVELTPAPWVGAKANSIGQSNSGIFLKSDNVNGLEVEVTIPTSGNSENVGFIIETYSEELSTYNGIELAWRQDSLSWSFENEYPSSGQLYEIDRAANLDETYNVAVIHTGSRMELYINGERVANLNSTFSPSHWLIGSFNDYGNPFSVSIDNVRVLRPSSETLDGSGLFLDSDDPVSLTLEFENNLITSTFEDNGGPDSGTESGIAYDYIISDESIFSITFTETIVGDYMTFDRSTNRGKLYDFKDDGQIDTSGTWDFTFETILPSFQGYAPTSLVGKTIYIPEYGYESNYSFTEDEAYYVDPGKTLDHVDGISYSYVANTSTTATLTLAREDGDVTHQISFSSPTTADSNWTDLESNETGSATLQILTEDYWPSSLAGWSYQGSSMNDTFYFVDEGHAVFYDASDSNFSNQELSNITYTWEQVGPRIGKLTTSLDEETLLFFESNTSGFFDWEEIGSDNGNSGQFDLFYYPSGKAFESLVGSSITIGDTTYVFTSTNAVTVHSPSGTSSQEYAYLRENEDEVLLSVGSSLYKLKFYNHQYGRIIEGGSGYFSIHQNWATKGWVYYDELPWIYSNNQGEWMYQVLSNNNATDETELFYYEPWANVWSQNLDLNYTDQRVFSTWEDYDDFSGPELNSSKWDVGYWGGGQTVTINDGKAHLSGGDFSSNAPIQMPSDLVAAAQDSTEGNTFLFFKNSEIFGIEADLTIPSFGNETEVGIYLASLDTSPLESLGIELVNDAYGSFIKLDYLDSAGQESEVKKVGSLNQAFNLRITKLNGNTSHYIDGDLVHTFPSASRDADYWVIGAFNDNGKPYTTYAENVRVLRKKSYPQGWMWTEYYPWAYSHETGGWLYFELAKDTDGKPVMNYYDHNTKAWDLYGPSLNQFYDR